MRCPNCNIGELEFEDDIDSESWSYYQGDWTCTNCKAVYSDFVVTGWQRGADYLEDADDDIDYDDDLDEDDDYEYDIDDAEAGE